MLVLRDGRKLIGVLRSWDQFGRFIAPVNPIHSLLSSLLTWPTSLKSESRFSRYDRALLHPITTQPLRRCQTWHLSRPGRERSHAWRDRS